MSPAYKRWYDHDPKLLEVIELLKNYQDENNKCKEVKIGKDIRDLSKGHKIPEHIKELLDELEDYNWLEDSDSEMEI